MDLDDTTADRLNALSALSGDTDLSRAVVDLANSAMASVSSWLALRVTMPGTEEPILIMTPAYFAGDVLARSSLRLQISATDDDDLEHSIVFLAEDADAFQPFRSSVLGGGVETGLTIREMVVNRDVPIDGATGFAAREAGASIDARQIVEQAVGILVDHGWTDARGRLRTLAEASDRTVLQAAHAVVQSLD